MKYSLLLRFTALALLCFGAASAQACVCTDRGATMSERIARTIAVGQVAFLGRANSRATVSGHSSFTRAAGSAETELEQIRFSVVRAWSGPEGDRVAVLFDQNTSCDASLRLGRIYLVLAQQEGDGLESSRCGVFELTDADARGLLSNDSLKSQRAPPNQPLHPDALTRAGERRR